MTEPAVFGIVDPHPPLKGFPEGKLKVRMGCEDFVIVQVRTPERVRAFTVKEEDGHWVPGFETDPPPYGMKAGQQIKELTALVQRYRRLLFGPEYREESLDTIRALAAMDDTFGYAHFAIPQADEPTE